MIPPEVLKTIRKIGGPVLYMIVHLLGILGGAFMTRVPAKIPKKFSRATSMTFFIVIVIVFDIAAYVLLNLILDAKHDIDMTSALFVGSIAGILVVIYAHQVATRGNIFWDGDVDSVPLGSGLVASYAMVLAVFAGIPFIALRSVNSSST